MWGLRPAFLVMRVTSCLADGAVVGGAGLELDVGTELDMNKELDSADFQAPGILGPRAARCQPGCAARPDLLLEADILWPRTCVWNATLSALLGDMVMGRGFL